MLFKPELIEKIVKEEKKQTRRLMKEGEELVNGANLNPETPDCVVTSKDKLKWQVGRDYVVCSGRGKKGVWWCPKCKILLSVESIDLFKKYFPLSKAQKEFMVSTGIPCSTCKSSDLTEPLRIRVIAISKERLLDITESDAEKEGFKSKFEFLDYIYELYKKTSKERANRSWNLLVWVLDFLVVK